METKNGKSLRRRWVVGSFLVKLDTLIMKMMLFLGSMSKILKRITSSANSKHISLYMPKLTCVYCKASFHRYFGPKTK